MESVARRLAQDGRSILEPLQAGNSLDEQVLELASIIQQVGTTPLTIVGQSWGSTLTLVLTAKHPSIVKKLILMSSGPFDKTHAEESVNERRIARLPDAERAEAEELLAALRSSRDQDRDGVFARLVRLLTKADAYEPITLDTQALEYQADRNSLVAASAEPLIESGEILALAARIQCPVVAIHGDYDPHPREGVDEPLRNVIRDFRFEVIERCGHVPWIERHAAERFFELLENELPRDR